MDRSFSSTIELVFGPSPSGGMTVCRAGRPRTANGGSGMPAANEPGAGFDGRVRQFERDWQAGRSPPLANYLGPPGQAPHDLLIELAHIDLEFRLKAGQSVRASDYLCRYPQLGADKGAAADLIATEYQLRRRNEPGLSFDAVLSDYP